MACRSPVGPTVLEDGRATSAAVSAFPARPPVGYRHADSPLPSSGVLDSAASHGNPTIAGSTGQAAQQRSNRTSSPVSRWGPGPPPVRGHRGSAMSLTFRQVERPALPDEETPVILIIDDDHLTRDSLAATLSIEGFDVLIASTGDEGLALVSSGSPSLVILDTQIGDSEGFAVFRRITSIAPWTPVIMITEQDDEIDAVLALEAGAADHIIKPPRPRELTARIRAVLRRVSCQPQSHLPSAPSGAYTFGPVTVDVARREATMHGRDVELSRKEFDLLTLLVSEGGHVVTRKQCMDRIWKDRKKGDSRTLDTHVKRLRKKIEISPAEPIHLITVRGLGYRFKP
jgi:two-component system response regulator RegX3